MEQKWKLFTRAADAAPLVERPWKTLGSIPGLHKIGMVA